MKINSKKFTLFILMFLPLIVSLIALNYLPNQIPDHYNFQGEVDRIGIKYEVLILPIMTIIISGGMIIVIKVLSNNTKYKENIRSMEISTIAMTIVFNIISCVILVTSFNKVQSSDEFDFLKPIAIALSILAIVLGNYIPKCKKNYLMGIRTKWTLESDDIWYRTHRYCGKLMVIMGLVLTVLSFFIEGKISLIILLIVLVGLDVMLMGYLHKISKEK